MASAQASYSKIHRRSTSSLPELSLPSALPLAPDVAATPKDTFAALGMLTLLGAELIQLEAGRCVLGLAYRPEVSQQHGYLHGGAIGAIADVAGGLAACSMAQAGKEALTVEYKLSIFSPARGARLEASARYCGQDD